MWQKVDFTWQLAMTSSVVGLRRSFKALPKAKLAPKKGHGHCMEICCLSDPLQLSESQQSHYIWEICSANGEMYGKLQCLQPASYRKGPILLHHDAPPHIAQPMLQKLNEFWFLPGIGLVVGLQDHMVVLSLAFLRKLNPGLYNNLEGWDREEGGREVQKGVKICIAMADSC